MVLALGLAGFAYWQWGVATEQRDAAERSNARVTVTLADRLRVDGERTRALDSLLRAMPSSSDPTASADLHSALYRALWSTYQSVRVADASYSEIEHVRFYGNRILLSSAKGQTIALIDTATGATVQHFKIFPGRVVASALSRAGDRLAVLSDVFHKPTLMEFFVDSGQIISSRRMTELRGLQKEEARMLRALGGPSFIWYDAFADLIKRIALASGEKLIWEGAEGALSAAPEGAVVALSEDQNAALTTRDKVVHHVDLKGGASRPLSELDSHGVFSLSPKGDAAIVFLADANTLQLWSMVDRQGLQSSAILEASPIVSGGRLIDAWSPQKNRYAIVIEGGRVDIYCLPEFLRCQQLDVSHASIRAISFDTAGSSLVAVTQRTETVGINIATYRLAGAGRGLRVEGLSSDPLAISADGTRIYAYTTPKLDQSKGFVEAVPNSSHLAIADTAGLRLVRQPVELRSIVTNGNVVAALAGYRPTQVLLFDPTGAPIRQFEVAGSAERLVTWPAGHLVIIDSGMVTTFDERGKQLGQMPINGLVENTRGPSGRLLMISESSGGYKIIYLDGPRVALTVSSEGISDLRALDHRKVAILWRDRRVTVRDVASGVDEHTVTVPFDHFEVASLSPTGRHLALTSGPVIFLYNLETGSASRLRHGTSVEVGVGDSVSQTIFLRAEDFLVSSGTDGIVKMWRLDGHHVVDLARFKKGVFEMHVVHSAPPKIILRSSADEIASMELLPQSRDERLRMAQSALK